MAGDDIKFDPDLLPAPIMGFDKDGTPVSPDSPAAVARLDGRVQNGIVELRAPAFSSAPKDTPSVTITMSENGEPLKDAKPASIIQANIRASDKPHEENDAPSENKPKGNVHCYKQDDTLPFADFHALKSAQIPNLNLPNQNVASIDEVVKSVSPHIKRIMEACGHSPG